MHDESRTLNKISAAHLGVLVRMLGSHEARERDAAVRAFREMVPEDIAALLGDPGLAPDALEYFARHAGSRNDWVEALLSNPSLPDEHRKSLSTAVSPPDGNEEGDLEEEEDLNISQRIQRMNVGQKIKAAMKGDKEMRTILIKDTNREVYMAVLNNPGLKENEIEMLAKNTGTSVEILRAVGNNREWVANRNIMHALVMNPKTPVNLSIRFLSRLGRKEVEFVAKSRSLPVALRNTAKRMISSKVKRK